MLTPIFPWEMENMEQIKISSLDPILEVIVDWCLGPGGLLGGGTMSQNGLPDQVASVSPR